MLQSLNTTTSRLTSGAAPPLRPTSVEDAVTQLRASPATGLAATLAGLAPEQQSAAIAQLSPRELGVVTSDLQGGSGGLSVDARRDALAALAGSLDATQLSRLSSALPAGARADLAAAVERSAPPSVRAAFAGRDDISSDAVVAGVGAAGGRDQYVGMQTSRTADAAARAPIFGYAGDLLRAVPSARSPTYADHSFSSGGRYNAPGQSTLYTSPTLSDLRAEVGNYDGLSSQSVMRSHFSGPLLDARALPGVKAGALTEPYGKNGAHRTALSRLTGEDSYTLPRAVGDAARARGLSGVIAPANRSSVNVALFPDHASRASATGGAGALATHLTYLDQTDYDAAGVPGGAARANGVAPNIPDATPNRASPAVDPANYATKVSADASAHSRASGARYGAAGATLAGLVDDARQGRFDPRGLAEDAAGGAAAGHADTLLSHAIDSALRPPVAPAGVAGGSLASAETNAMGAAARPVSFTAGVASGSIINGAISGGVTVWNDADAVRSGRLDAGHATADVVVNTGVGLGAGAAGAAAGAAVGSVVPVAGTAVGAVVGFGVGLGASWLAQHSGAVDYLKAQIGGSLEAHFEKPLEAAWGKAAAGVGTVRQAGHTVEHVATRSANALTHEISYGTQGVAHAMGAAGAAFVSVAGAAEHATASAAQTLRLRVASAVGGATQGARNVASSAWKTVSSWL